MDSGPSQLLILGPILLGGFFGWGLYGALCLQIYLYYRWYPEDRLTLKLLVPSLLVLETAETVISTYISWVYMVSGWGTPGGLFPAPWPFCIAVILTGVIATMAQLFFAYRVWIFSHSIPIIAAIVILSLAQCGSAIAGAAQVKILTIENSANLSTFDVFSIWLACSAACDILIAVSVVYFLARTRSTLGLQSTDFIVTRMINFSVQTGTITAVFAVLTLILFLAFKANDLQDAPYVVYDTSYSNTVLANLNARDYLFSRMEVHDGDMVAFASRPGVSVIRTSRAGTQTAQIDPLTFHTGSLTLKSQGRDVGCQTRISLEELSHRFNQVDVQTP
ncbi:hypothetical protein M422DRAFT_32901 [Sphaerobolus stellatus SS14]|uniref:DUF6534 domain-containing protein n=1 Tax=Sphaerobolus stellatus (strain SS14) TaxID=990650 RepID=A0A0C9VBV6_SPHS4|nr:hypothetical protein M422DRAFT_32901 [Sphaerobolus stellatus SS14]